jgi:hypothetical protein
MLMYLFTHRNLDGHRSLLSRQVIWYAARRGALVGIVTVCIVLTLLQLTLLVAGRLGLPDIFNATRAVAVGCVSGLITGLIYGVSRGQLKTHASSKPNQGIWRSLYNGGRVLLVAGLIVWVVYDLLVLTQASPQEIIDFTSQQLLTGVIAGISSGFFFGLLNGGIACIHHVLLHVFLWRARVLPWNYARFLDYTAERILLSKVGGGYIFVHRLLLEYFASLVTPFPEEALAVVVISDEPPVLSSTSQMNTGSREEKASLAVPGRKTGFDKEKRILVLFVVVLLLEFSCGPSIFGVVQHAVQNTNDAAATDQTRFSDAIATSEAQAQATAQVEPNATAEALANASPIAYPPHNQSPVLNDPLQDNSKGNNWEVDDPRNGHCKFINRTYDIITNQSEWCLAMSTDFTNFIYEIQMTIVKGDEGGIVFRIDPTNEYEDRYEFFINRDGSYRFLAYTPSPSTSSYYIAVLALGSSSAIHRGLNQTNLVAAVVHDKIIELYVNHQRIAVVSSSTYSHGRIGVIVTGSKSNQIEVIFQNAKVWKL